MHIQCVNCRSTSVVFYREQRRDGGYHVRCTCNECGADALGKPFIRADDYGLDKDTLPIMALPEDQLIPCDVRGCTNTCAQLHHLAPKNKFDGASDSWPTMWACHFHHVEWHWRVEGLNLDNAIVSQLDKGE